MDSHTLKILNNAVGTLLMLLEENCEVIEKENDEISNTLENLIDTLYEFESTLAV